MKTKRLRVGTRVHYIPFPDCDNSQYENGIVKGPHSNPEYVFVVFKCADDWDNYQNYTGIMTPVDMLEENWVEIDPENNKKE